MNPNHENQQIRNRNAILFVVKLIVLYLVFSQGNRFMNGLFVEGGYYNAFFADNFNYIQGLRTSLLASSVWIIKLFGFYAIYNQSDVMVVNGPYLQVNYDCLGLGVMSFLAAFVIAYPTKWKAKCYLLFLGMILIYVLNIFRIAGLGIVLAEFPSQQTNFTYHHEVFNLFLYLSVFLLIFFWMRRNSIYPSGR